VAELAPEAAELQIVEEPGINIGAEEAVLTTHGIVLP
jgi:hypothetical protein